MPRGSASSNASVSSATPSTTLPRPERNRHPSIMAHHHIPAWSSSSTSKTTRTGNQCPLPSWITIPPVPDRMVKAIRSSLQQTPEFQHKTQLHQLQTKWKDQQNKITLLQERIELLEEQKQERIQDIRTVREDQLKEAMSQVEEQVKWKFEKERKKEENKWKQETDRKYQDLKEKLESEEPPAKKQKTEDTATKQSAKVEEPEVSDHKSKEKQEEIDGLQAKLDGLTEAKTELVWLLKSVIMAARKKK